MRTLIIAGVLATLAAAQSSTTILYPGGPSATSGGGLNSVPFASTFQTEIHYQLHIPAADLPNRPAMLTDVAFVPGASGTFTSPNFILSVGHGVPGGLTCSLATNSPDLRLQYSGPFSWTYTGNAWNSLGLPTLFPYDGLSGMVVEIRYLGNTGGTSFQSRDTGTNVNRVYNRLAGGFNATQCSHSVSLGIKPRLTFVQAGVGLAAPPAAGTVLPLTFDAPTDPLFPYLGGLSLGIGPIPFSPTDLRTIGLDFDDLLVFTLTYPWIFPGISGTLDGFGLAQCFVPLPASLPPGFTFYAAFVTLDPNFPSTVRSISLTTPVVIL